MQVMFILTTTGGVVAERPGRRPPLGSSCDRGGESAARGAGDVLRCPCGSLLARHVPGGIELKCRRCKRAVVIPIKGEEEAPAD